MVGRSGRPVANQFIIETESFLTFQSYESVIAQKEKRIPYDETCGRAETVLDSVYWDYSRTTMKYLAQFLGCSGKEVRQRVKDGTYTLIKLNV